MKTHKNLMAAVMLTATSAIPALASEPVCPVDVLSNIKGIATFNSDDVNLRKGPSATEGCLCYLGEPETYYQPERMIWTSELEPVHLANMDIMPDYEVIQGHKGWDVAVLDNDGQWAQLFYGPHEMWAESDAITVRPITPVTTSTRYMAPDYNSLNVTGANDGDMVVLYQELGRVNGQGEGLLFGHMQDGAVVFDAFLPAVMHYDASSDALSLSDDSGNVVVTYGPGQKVPGLSYDVIDVTDFSDDNLKSLFELASPLPASQQHVLVACADDAVLL